MSKADILSELPKLKPEERRELLESLWELEEYQRNPNAGSGWDGVALRLRGPSGR